MCNCIWQELGRPSWTQKFRCHWAGSADLFCTHMNKFLIILPSCILVTSITLIHVYSNAVCRYLWCFHWNSQSHVTFQKQEQNWFVTVYQGYSGFYIKTLNLICFQTSLVMKYAIYYIKCCEVIYSPGFSKSSYRMIFNLLDFVAGIAYNL